MIFHAARLQDAYLIEPEIRADERGSFARMMCRDEFSSHGLIPDYVQHNMSISTRAGTIRGMHYQRAPFSEAKLVRCLRGAILDIIVDLRAASSTYLEHGAFELTAENQLQLYVPPGFAHGFQTLVDNVEVSYLVSAPYTPAAEGGVRYSDPLLAIRWPLPVSVISTKDNCWPHLDPIAPPIF